MTAETRTEQDAWLLWIAFGAPALAWFFQLSASYTIAAYACAHDQLWILHTISAVALLLSGLGIWCGWRCWKSWRARDSETGSERRFLAAGAILLAGLFFLTIFTAELSNWFLEPCV